MYVRCNHCTLAPGKFRGCVVLKGYIQGRCTNCHYACGRKSDCTYYDEGSRIRATTGSVARRRVDSTTSNIPLGNEKEKYIVLHNTKNSEGSGDTVAALDVGAGKAFWSTDDISRLQNEIGRSTISSVEYWVTREHTIDVRIPKFVSSVSKNV